MNDIVITVAGHPQTWPGATGTPGEASRESEVLVEQVVAQVRATLLASMRSDFADGVPFPTLRHKFRLDGAALPQQADKTMGEGRVRERADVLDFIRHPPGRVPDHLRTSLAELASAIERGQHVGCASRIYEDLLDVGGEVGE